MKVGHGFTEGAVDVVSIFCFLKLLHNFAYLTTLQSYVINLACITNPTQNNAGQVLY